MGDGLLEMDVIFDKDFPEMIKPDIEALLNKVVWLCPLWLLHLTVGYGGNERNVSASIVVDKNYRFARLNIGTGFIDSNHRLQDLYHEIFHCFNNPLFNKMDYILDLILPDDKNPQLKEALKEMLRCETEGVTQDFSQAICRKFENE